MFFEDDTFEILSLENDIFYESIRLDSLKYSIMEDIYTENENSAFDRFKKFIDSVVKKIKSFFKKVKDAISDFFTHKNIDDKLNDLEKDIKENPELGKLKVKVHDYTKLEQLNNQAISDLNHRVESTEKIMEKYRKQRNGIIAAGIATTTLSFLAAVAMAKHVKSECNARLKSKSDFACSNIDLVHKRINDVQCNINKLSKHVNTNEEQIQSYLKKEQQLLNAYAECMADNFKYSVDKVQRILNDVISFGKINGAVPE